MIVRRRWLAKDEINIIDLLNASDTFRNFKVVLNDLFSEYGFNQVQKSSVFGAFFRSRKLVASLAGRGF